MSKFHKNMLALMHYWFPDRNEKQNASTLFGMYALESYDPKVEPYPVVRQSLIRYLTYYRSCK